MQYAQPLVCDVERKDVCIRITLMTALEQSDTWMFIRVSPHLISINLNILDSFDSEGIFTNVLFYSI
jgi:hypothetical protein